jgi:uncharacterized protein (TIGR03435 family)
MHSVSAPQNDPGKFKRRAPGLNSSVWCCLLIGTLLGGIPWSLMAQPATAEAPRFEVASIKPATENKHGLWYSGSRVQILGLSVHELIAAAYRLKDYQVFGPKWIDSARFDVEAKLPDEAVGLADSAKSAQIWLMTQALLTERFGTKVHRETRKIGALKLVVDDHGPKFKELGPDPGYNVTVTRGRGQLSAQKLPMRQFVEILGSIVEVPLIDKTGITGVFDVKLQWVPESTSPDSRPADIPGAPDIRTALPDQLGLKLVSAKLPVEVVVVDNVKTPSAN